MSTSDLKEALSNLLEVANYEPVTYRTICNNLAGKGYPILLILLSLPFSTPITIPGFSTAFGIAIGFIGLRMAFGYHLWWPDWILNKEVSYSNLEKIVNATISLVNRLQKFLHPRLDYFSTSPILRRVNGLLIFLLSIFLALPLPLPFSNMIPALPILIISLGILENDGLFIIIGYVLSTVCFLIFILLFWKGVEFFNWLLAIF